MQPEIDEILNRLKLIESLLAKNSQIEFINANEAAAYLNISTNYLYKLTSEKKFPFYKPSGKLIYFKKSELDNWISQSRIKSKKEIEAQAISIVINNKHKK